MLMFTRIDGCYHWIIAGQTEDQYLDVEFEVIKKNPIIATMG